MEKLTIGQLIKLSEILESPKFNWLVFLIDMNNKGKITDFLNTINQKNLIAEIINSERKSDQLKR